MAITDPSIETWQVARTRKEKSNNRHRRLLCVRGEGPRGCRAANHRYELALAQLIRLHSVARQPGSDCRISNWQRVVSGPPQSVER
jgi:hypothetical protein